MYTSSDHAHSSERLLALEESQFDDKDARMGPSKPKSYLKAHAGLIFQILLFLTSVTMLLMSSIQYRNLSRACERKCYDFVPQWSPALESVENTGRFSRFDGSFATPNAFKGTPNPEIDVSWDDITYATGTSSVHSHI